jgi:hypothetical protein
MGRMSQLLGKDCSGWVQQEGCSSKGRYKPRTGHSEDHELPGLSQNFSSGHESASSHP